MSHVLNTDGTFRSRNGNGCVEVAKIDRLKWNKNLGKQGKLILISKNDLRIDKEYQRGSSEQKSSNIASNFDWGGFGVLIVIKRKDGTFYVIDGQHRALAAVMRDDIDKVPCLVFEDIDIRQEARLFVIYNKNRKAMSGQELWKAQVVGEDEVAVEATKIATRMGYTIGSSSRKDGSAINCTQAVYALQKNGRFLPILRFVTAVWPDSAMRTDNGVLNGVDAFARKLFREAGLELDNPEVVRAFKMCPLSKLTNRMNLLRELEGRGGKRGAFCLAMAERWNKGRQKHRINVFGGAQSKEDAEVA